MQNFAAIDFETANNERSSVCSVGIVIVRDGKIVDKFYSLSSQRQNTIIVGAPKYMVCLWTTQWRLLYFLMYGLKLSL